MTGISLLLLFQARSYRPYIVLHHNLISLPIRLVDCTARSMFIAERICRKRSRNSRHCILKLATLETLVDQTTSSHAAKRLTFTLLFLWSWDKLKLETKFYCSLKWGSQRRQNHNECARKKLLNIVILNCKRRDKYIMFYRVNKVAPSAETVISWLTVTKAIRPCIFCKSSAVSSWAM